ncbi:MAG: tripartite tricarboxylate transporter substrate binding protein [Caldimonas sp.]
MKPDRFMPTLLARLLLAIAVLLASPICAAQAWPSKPVRFVVPFPAGGSTDVVARLIADKLSASLKQSFVIDNRGGAGGTLGSDIVAKAPPDGYTMLLGTSSTHAIASSLYSKLPYSPSRDFVPVSLIGTATILLVVNPSVPARSVRELIGLAKAKPGQLTFASSGNGSVSHLTGAYFASQAGISIQHIPYKGDSPMITDLIGGQVSMAFGTAVAFLPQVRNGKLVALAVADARPSSIAPGVPTIADAALPGFEALQWFGILMPAGTPADIVSKLHAEVDGILRMPDVRDRLGALGIEVATKSPAEFAAFMQAETTKWAKIVRDSGAKID